MKYTKVKVFEKIGENIDMIARFSTVVGELGTADRERNLCGFP
jgi:catalase